ncbi:MAG: hypothetical protein K2Z81_20300, partial [Cyanobacteria bacterium]|nr:hypothetical protein [Cyanobacteriota bacterium]
TLTGTADINGEGNAGDNVITGNAGKNELYGGAGGNDSLRGGQGNDTYVIDSAGDTITENEASGDDLVRSSISYTLGANLEKLTLVGTAALNGAGNTLANLLTGNAGNNALDGGADADRMIGGDGDDTYTVDNAGDSVEEGAGVASGRDTVLSSVTYTLTANVEDLELQGSGSIRGAGNALANVVTGNSGNNLLTGNDGNDTLKGGDGNDTLDGGSGNDTLDGEAGADQMAGGAGDDSYVVDSSDDSVVEEAEGGLDTVLVKPHLGAMIDLSIDGFLFSFAGYRLEDHVENSLIVGNGEFAIAGNDLANYLIGNSGRDILWGGGGADRMQGGGGDDSYFLDDVNDVVIEEANDGFDRVIARVDYDLVAKPNVEELRLEEGAGAIRAEGNEFKNILVG